jgi:hypothetical protein
MLVGLAGAVQFDRHRHEIAVAPLSCALALSLAIAADARTEVVAQNHGNRSQCIIGLLRSSRYQQRNQVLGKPVMTECRLRKQR